MQTQDQKDVFTEILVELADADPRVIALSADMGTRIIPDFLKKRPHRYFNFGVAEQNMVSEAAGLAYGGMLPFVTTISAFLSMRACEQIRTDICYPSLNVKIVGTGGGLAYGVLGPTHMGLEDIGILRTFPNLTLLSPADAPEMGWAVRAAYAHEGPVYIRIDRGKVPVVYEHADFRGHRIGKAHWLRGEDEDVQVAIIATGVMVHEAVKAAERLAEWDVDASVLNIHTLKPLDEDAICRASRRARAMITVEDHTVIGGLGSAVAACMTTNSDADLIPLRIMGIPDTFPHETDDAEGLRARYGLNAAGIVDAASTI